MVPLRVAAVKVSVVPIVTVPVLVIVSGVLATTAEVSKVPYNFLHDEPGMGTLHPLINGAAMAKTSLGVNAMSNAAGTTVPVPEKILRTVWWRASTLRIEAAAAKRTGSVRSVAPPIYAAIPTASTTRAVAAIVATSVNTESKLKVHPEIGALPAAFKAA